MSDVFGAIGSALYSKLAGDAALVSALGGSAVYHMLAPQGTSTPYVVFSYAGGGDENASPVRTRNLVYLVKTVTSGYSGHAQGQEIDGLVDGLLHFGTLALTGWTSWWMARESDLALVETQGGTVFWHHGANYRIRLVDP